MPAFLLGLLAAIVLIMLSALVSGVMGMEGTQCRGFTRAGIFFLPPRAPILLVSAAAGYGDKRTSQ